MIQQSGGQRVNVSLVSGVMVVSIQGEPRSSALQQLREDLLGAAANQRARGLVLDLSGISGLDTDVMAHLQATSAMLKLMGVTSVFAGIRPGMVAALSLLSLEWTALPCEIDVDRALLRFDAVHKGPP